MSQARAAQKEICRKLLEDNFGKRVQMSSFWAAGVGYTGRNRVSELKKEYEERGLTIEHGFGHTHGENWYMLTTKPATTVPGEFFTQQEVQSARPH